MSDLDELITKLGELDPKEREKLVKDILSDPVAGKRWAPNPGPQKMAYDSLADEMLYGGQAGGGKSGLIVGLALTKHNRSLIMRRQYTDLGALISDCLEKHGTRNGFSGAPPARLRFGEDNQIDFGAAKDAGDEESWRGQAHDLLAIDEASQFLESQVRFLMGWVRSAKEGQRCRTILASNPPENPAQGQWLREMYGPWLDPAHPLHPTPDGVLRWYVRDEIEERDIWVDSPEPVEVEGRTKIPLSRTFIGAHLQDNPFLRDTKYAQQLDALPEPLRSAVRDGNWLISHKDDEWQVIPTNWILAAQQRWTRNPPLDVPMCSIGVDPAQGGENQTILAPRYDWYFPELICKPGRETPAGSDVAALIIKHRRNDCEVVVDMGGGYGGDTYNHLKSNNIKVIGHRGGDNTGETTEDRMLRFFNKRALVYWRFREALNPDQDGGSDIALPPDAQLVADLTSIRYDVTKSIVKLELKKDIVKRLGRSPDRGDAVVMAYYYGQKRATRRDVWQSYTNSASGGVGRVNRSYETRKRRNRR